MLTLLARILAGRLFKTAEGEVKAGWSWVFSSATHILETLLVLSIAGNLWQHHSLASCELDKKVLAANQKAVVKGQAQAAADQVAANHAPAAASAQIAKESDDDKAGVYQAGYRAGDAYARAHSVRPGEASGGASSAASVPGTDRPVASDDRPGAADGMVAVPRADFDTCTYYGARLDKVHEDAWKLIAAGAATTSEGGTQ